jgi:hypothetical protein
MVWVIHGAIVARSFGSTGWVRSRRLPAAATSTTAVPPCVYADEDGTPRQHIDEAQDGTSWRGHAQVDKQ